MILFTLLLMILTLLIIFTVVGIAVGGSAFVILFGDVIVCMALIVLLMKHTLKKTK